MAFLFAVSMNSSPHPAALTGLLKQAATTEALLDTHRMHESQLNEIHLSGLWRQLGQLAKQGPAEHRWLQRKVQALEPLVQHTVRAAKAGEVGQRQLANIAHGAACCGMGR